MLVVKDAMVLIHLATLTLLETTCAHLGAVVIPPLVHEETVIAGRERGYPDAEVIAETIDAGHVEVREVTEERWLDRAHRYSIQRGEAEAVALYWELDADRLATDDDNVRQKQTVLDLDLVGTPSLLVERFESSAIDDAKLSRSLDVLREVGWFSTAVLDAVEQEVGLA